MLTTLSLEDKKGILFATRLRFGSEMKVPRERAIDLMVEKALYFADEEHPFTPTHIAEVFRDIWRVPAIRHQKIRDSLIRLSKTGRAMAIAGGHIPSDSLGGEISAELSVAARSLDEVVSRLFADFDTDWGRIDLRNLFLTLIADIFSEFGDHWVRSLAGTEDAPRSLRSRDLERLLARRFTAQAIPEELRPLISEKIAEFFKDTGSPLYNGVKFNFAQGFYVAKLIGYNTPIDVLSLELYNGATFCLDSNVVLAVLLVASRHNRSIRELATLCERLNAKLVVTEETLEEASYVAEREEKLAASIYDRIPQHLVEKTKGHFFQAYRLAKKEDPELTIEEFFAPFRRLRQVLKDELKAEIVAATYSDFHSDSRLTAIKNQLQEASQRIRDISKKEGALRHDAVHYLWVAQERHKCPKTWFVTLDRSLPVASARINKTGVPFALNLDGLLQSLSTFLTVDDHSYAGFSDIFSRLIAAQMTPLHPVFDVSDFAIFDDLGMECGELPADDVDKALSQIKKGILKGAPYADGPREDAMYALRTFFAMPEKRMRVRLAEKDQELQGLRERLAVLETKISLSANRADQAEGKALELHQQLGARQQHEHDLKKGLVSILLIETVLLGTAAVIDGVLLNLSWWKLGFYPVIFSSGLGLARLVVPKTVRQSLVTEFKAILDLLRSIWK